MPVLTDPSAERPPARKKTSREIVFEPFRRGVRLGGRTVRPGSAGDDVVRLQRILNRHGKESLTVDGLFGPKTEAAVKRFQRRAKLKADGVVDRDTWSALGW